MFELVYLMIIILNILGSNYIVSTQELCGDTSFRCENDGLNLNYPFWSVTNSYSYCGYKGLGVNCSTGKPILRVVGRPYSVTTINYSYQTLIAADLEPGRQPCAAPHDDPVDGSGNKSTSSSKINFYYYGRDTKILYFYRNCTWKPPTTSKLDVSCLDSRGTTLSYFLTDDETWTAKRGRNCNELVKIPVVNKTNDISNLGTYARVMQGGFLFSWLSNDEQCLDCERYGGRCRYDQSGSDNLICICSNGKATANGSNCTSIQGNHTFPAPGNPPFAGPGNHTFPAPGNPPFASPGAGNHTLGSASAVKKKIVIGVMSGLGSLVLIILLSLYTYRKKKFSSLLGLICAWSDKKSTTNVEVFLENCGPLFLQRYTYSNLKKITNFFKDKLGQGGYGGVFKGKLKDGSFVAVKVLNESKGNGEEFTNEVVTIGRTNHINIVRLIGFCAEQSKRALVYEYMPNGSLEKFIYNEKSPTTTHPLGQEKLYQIALGIANGLEYLHRGCNTRILHFDIKPHNILLDTDFCPKISDFGLAKLCPSRESVVSMHNARGTMGYIAPEVICKNFGGVSPKSDVYSYGMMVLEMVGGRKNIDTTVDNISEIYFPLWIYNHLEKQEMNGLGEINEGFEEENIKKMIIVGLWCIQNQPANRPSMSMVVEMLQKSVNDLQMPPNPFVDLPTSS